MPSFMGGYWRPEEVRQIVAKELRLSEERVVVVALGPRKAAVCLSDPVAVPLLETAGHLCFFDLGVGCSFEIQVN
jgi:hypothetical protein